MRYILLSADHEPTLYEVPDALAEHLSDWAEAFLENVYAPGSLFRKTAREPSGKTYAIYCYDEQDFVIWLNQQDITNDQKVQEPESMSPEERELILKTAEMERNYPYEQQQYPWFNF